MATKICPSCKREIPKQSIICSYCGLQFNNTIEKKKDSNKWKNISAIMIIFLIVCAAIVIFLSMSNNNSKKFDSAVNKYIDDWETLETRLDSSNPDALSIDVSYKVISGDLWEISEIYKSDDDKTYFNGVLSDKINQYMFHEALIYNENTTGTSYEYANELVSFYEKPAPFNGIELQNIKLEKGSDGYIHCKCTVINTKESNVTDYMQATVYYRDSSGNVLGYETYGIVDGDGIDAGESYELDLNSYIEATATSCDVVLDYQ